MSVSLLVGIGQGRCLLLLLLYAINKNLENYFAFAIFVFPPLGFCAKVHCIHHLHNHHVLKFTRRE